MTLQESLNDTTENDELALMLKAVGHPVRLRILEVLNKTDTCLCGEVCDCFSQSQSTISQHLSMLTKCGLVNCDHVGTKSCYSLNRAKFSQLLTDLATIFNVKESISLDR